MQPQLLTPFLRFSTNSFVSVLGEVLSCFHLPFNQTVMAVESGGSSDEIAAVWLKDAGLDYLISQKGNNEEKRDSGKVMFGSLTRRQSVTVQKRLREAGTLPMVFDIQRRRYIKDRGNSVSSGSPTVGRLVTSYSGPLDTVTPPQKSCVSMAMGSALLNAAKRSGSYDFGKLAITDSTVVLKSRRHVDIMEAYDACNPSETTCVYKEFVDRGAAPAVTAAASLIYEGFPIFSLTLCDVGLTLCHDLAPSDLIVVRHLSFIESSTVFDELNIRGNITNQSNNSSSSSLMGLLSGKSAPKSASTLPTGSLENMLAKSKSRGSQQIRVPIFIERLLAELCSTRCANTEGLFRVPPSQQRLRMLLQTIQSSDFNESQFDFSEIPPSDLAALLKHLIRSFSPSLLTASLEPQFVLAVTDMLPNEAAVTTTSTTTVPPSSVIRERLRLLNLLILQLNDVNRDTLQLLLSCLRHLAGPASSNRMAASSLALVLAPLFFPSLAALTDADHIHRQVLVVQFLIIYADVLFVVPNQLLDQVRLHNTLLNKRNFAARPKQSRKVALSWWRFWSRERVAARKLLTPASSSPVLGEQPVISVSTSKLYLTSKAANKSANFDDPGLTTTIQLRLRDDMKADEGIDLVIKNVLALTPLTRVPSTPGYKWFMFEVGGNINERCLDPKTNLLSTYRRNSCATWDLRLMPNNRILLPKPGKSLDEDTEN